MKLKQENEELSKLDILIAAMERERTATELKLYSVEKQCESLAEELRIERKASRAVISKAMSEAEDLMGKAYGLMKGIHAKERDLERMEAETKREAQAAIDESKIQHANNMKKALQRERRESLRQRAKGKLFFLFLIFLYLHNI